MAVSSRDVKAFFYSQYFSDGLRMAAGILFPALLLNQFNQFNLGITLSLGALCICTIDNPGPAQHKRNAMLAGNLFLFLVAVITGFARLNVFALGAVITLLSFAFSLFTVYGNRAASVGTCALLSMIFMMDKSVTAAQVVPYSATILAGGIWYTLFSLVFFGIRPYRAAQQALGENIADLAKFVRVKADFYLPETDIDKNYEKLVSQQIKVSQHQDGIREMLFKSRLLVKESTNASRVLVLTFVDLIDMFEQVMATHYDYLEIRDRFSSTGVLHKVSAILQKMADELDNLAYKILTHTHQPYNPDAGKALEQLKASIDAIKVNDENATNLALKKILINLRDLNERINSIYRYYEPGSAKAISNSGEKLEYSRFVSHQDYSPHIFTDNFSFKSAAFKHALRVSLVCLIGFVVAKFIAIGHHSYWVLLTIIVILKPGYSLSKQRNYQRLTGTIAGGAIGIAILLTVPDKQVQFIILVVLMIGTYSFLRLNYVVSVIFMTPYVLILFKFLGVGFVVKERIVDTVIGSSIAFLASYLIFPSWEFEQIQQSMADVLNANVNYLMRIAESMFGKETIVADYKLSRKDVFVKSANLSAAFERMTSEPKSKQKNVKEVHKFVVLNHILSSYIATIASNLTMQALHHANPDNARLLKKSIAVLNDNIEKLNGNVLETKLPKSSVLNDDKTANANRDNVLLKEQLGFINKISNDISRITDSVLAA